ncbi:hypothetical protein PFISCL1PPCAC_11601, partial [Pristionchus fissidentatus]
LCCENFSPNIGPKIDAASLFNISSKTNFLTLNDCEINADDFEFQRLFQTICDSETSRTLHMTLCSAREEERFINLVMTLVVNGQLDRGEGGMIYRDPRSGA